MMNMLISTDFLARLLTICSALLCMASEGRANGSWTDSRDVSVNYARSLHEEVAEGNDHHHDQSSKSVGFYLMEWDFTCESVPCSATAPDSVASLVLQNAYMHIVVGTDHPTSYGLLVYRMCETFQKCISPKNIKIILQHRQIEDTSVSFHNCTKFLNLIQVEYFDWWGTFTADNKMKQTYRILDNIHSDKRLIYQTDIDEIPDLPMLIKALEEFASGSCDAIRGVWRDRIARDGSFAAVVVDSQQHLEAQFPLRCEISNNVVGAGMTRKVIAYRANYRIDGGQHELWCDRSGDMHINGYWNKSAACTQHIAERNKAKLTSFIIPYLSDVNRRPKYCKHEVIIDHYKFLYGIESYLRKRIVVYQKLGFHWWRDSKKFLEHFKRHNGKVCVDCETSKCQDMVNNVAITSVPGKEF